MPLLYYWRIDWTNGTIDMQGGFQSYHLAETAAQRIIRRAYAENSGLLLDRYGCRPSAQGRRPSITITPQGQGSAT